MDQKESRKRKPNYSREEVMILLRGVDWNKKTLLANTTNTHSSNKLKLEVWRKICEQLNACHGVQRTVEEVRKKWKDLQTQAKRDLMCKRKPQTEGEPPPPAQGEFTSMILSLLGEMGTTDVSVEDSSHFEINLNSIQTLGKSDLPSSTVVIDKENSTDKSFDGSESVKSLEQCGSHTSESLGIQVADILAQASKREIGDDYNIEETKIVNSTQLPSMFNRTHVSAMKRKAASATSVTSSSTAAALAWDTERELLEKEKLKMEIEVLKLKRAKLQLQINDLTQKGAKDC